MKPDDDELARSLVERVMPQPPASPCPDENLLAGWAEGTLTGARAADVEEHLTRCDDCRRTAMLWREEAAAPEVPASDAGPVLDLSAARRRVRWLGVAVAAVAVAAIGLTVFRRTDVPTPPGTDARLVAVAQDLATAKPELFAGFGPVDRSTRESLRDDGTRGGVEILEPSGAVLDTPVRVRWTPLPAAISYAVVVADASGATIWKSTSIPDGAAKDATGNATLTFPKALGLAPGGHYVIEVTPETAIGSTTARRSFSIATDVERGIWTRSAGEILARAPADLARLVIAHAALRRGYVLEAERAARAQVEAFPMDTVATETLAYARRLLRSGGHR